MRSTSSPALSHVAIFAPSRDSRKIWKDSRLRSRKVARCFQLSELDGTSFSQFRLLLLEGKLFGVLSFFPFIENVFFPSLLRGEVRTGVDFVRELVNCYLGSFAFVVRLGDIWWIVGCSDWRMKVFRWLAFWFRALVLISFIIIVLLFLTRLCNNQWWYCIVYYRYES